MFIYVWVIFTIGIFSVIERPDGKQRPDAG